LPRTSERIVLEIGNKLSSKTYVAVYDDLMMLVGIYQLDFFDEGSLVAHRSNNDEILISP